MTRESLSDMERQTVKTIISDLHSIFDRSEITANNLGEIINNLESERVSRYIRALFSKAKPESALGHELLAGKNPFADYLFGQKISEVTQGGGFVDYTITEETHPIQVELKPAFTRRTDSQGAVTKLKREELNWKKHTDQIEKYHKENEYLILTDLRYWYFFSRYDSDPTTPINTEPILLDEFHEEFAQIENLTEYLDRQRGRKRTADLDEEFFKSLAAWIEEFESLDFAEDVSKEREFELLISTINKFIFAQTLDSYAVVDYRWIERTWERKENRWIHLGERRVLEEFLDELVTWFYEYYDTELFQGSLLDDLDAEPSNITDFFDATKRVLGIENYQQDIGVKGITNYNFREIDEDIFGKAYETYLVEVRRDQGIYYTPKYVTEDIVSRSVGVRFDAKVEEFHEAIEGDDFDAAEDALHEMTQLRVVDPACGSGSFLIKALREIWTHYEQVLSTLNEIEEENRDMGRIHQRRDDFETLQAVYSLRECLNYKTKRDLISKVILRHIHGVDIDSQALDIAKMNIWLEAIKLVRKDFRYDKITADDRYVLPDLEINLWQGDSLMALPEEEVVETLADSYSSELRSCFEHREMYLDEPKREAPIDEIKSELATISEELNTEFFTDVDPEDKDTIARDKPPLHWPLAFWYVYFGYDGDGNVKPKADTSGFDIVIGNPPYYSEPRGHKEDFRLYRQSPSVADYYEDKMDVFGFFVTRAIDLSHPDGRVGFIVPSYWNTRSSVKKMNTKLAKESKLIHVTEFNEYPVFDDPDIHSAILVFDVREPGGTILDEYTLPVFEVNDPSLAVSEVETAFRGSGIDGVRQVEKTIEYKSDSKRLSLQKKGVNDLVTHIENQGNIDINDNKQGVVLPQDKLSVSEEKLKQLPDRFENGQGIFVLSNEELNDIGPNNHERGLLKPFCRPRHIDPFFVDTSHSETLVYTEKKLIDYDGHDVYNKARQQMKDEGIGYSDATDNQKREYKQKVRESLRNQVRSKYPNITNHLDKFLERDLITSDRVPYGIHRSRDSKYFEGETRIISVRKTPYPKFAPVDEPCYMDEGVVSLRVDSPWRLAAVLNSEVLHFWYREGFGKTMGGMLQMDQEVIEAAPAKIPDPDADDFLIGALARDVYSLRQQWAAISSEWKRVATQLQSTTRSLEGILLNDKTYRQRGETELAWSSSVSFYPDEDNELLSQGYDAFGVSAEIDSCTLTILGINKGAVDDVYRIELDDEARLDHTYLSLQRSIASGRRMNSLSDVLEKTKIPIIKQKIAENTPNIVTEAKNNTKEIDNDSIVSIKNSIDEKEMQIDAQIFVLYDLSRTKAALILDSLGTRNSRQNTILNKISKLSS